MTTVDVVLPGDIDDPAYPSGGNGYDRRVCHGLAARGWTVREHGVPGGWPTPSPAERAGLARLLDGLPDGATVLLDGLVASAVPDVLVPESTRLRLTVLVHMPLYSDGEAAVLGAARTVVTTSAWTRRRLLDRYGLPARRVHVATPGVEPAPVATGGGGLLCVAAVAYHKGYDRLVDALATLPPLSWTLTCVGSLERDPDFVAGLRARIAAAGLGARIRLAGPLTGPDLDAAYAAADLLVLASRGETYGMVVTEALARAVPVVAVEVGGVPEALGRAPDGTVPGLLVPPGGLAGALRRWLTEPGLRDRLRRSALARRETLAGWASTTALLAKALDETSLATEGRHA